MAVSRVRLLLNLAAFTVIFLLLLHKTTYGNNYTTFNRNVKNYRNNLLIIDEIGRQVAKYKVALADNSQKRGYGLMNLRNLDNEKGMLFLFKKHAIINMWMKNTLISLDMIFIDGDKIVHIVQNTEPKSLKYIPSKFEIDKVLEVNSGEVERRGLKVGYKIKL